MVSTSRRTGTLSGDNRPQKSAVLTSLFRREIDQIEVLPHEEIVLLAQKIESGQAELRKKIATERDQRAIEEGELAQRKLIEANIRLVYSTARKYRSLDVDFMDLVQEGTLGLIHAAQKFDYRKGYKFGTYAIWWIRQYIVHALVEEPTIHVPLYKQAKMQQLARARSHLQQKLAGEPTPEDLAGQLDMSVQQVINLLVVARTQAISLDLTKRVGDEDLPLSDLLEDDAVYRPERVVEAQILETQIHELLEDLTPRERWVIRLRYGLAGNREHTLHEAARAMNMSHEGVRQIEARALEKLEAPCRKRNLQEYLQEM